MATAIDMGAVKYRLPCCLVRGFAAKTEPFDPADDSYTVQVKCPACAVTHRARIVHQQLRAWREYGEPIAIPRRREEYRFDDGTPTPLTNVKFEVNRVAKYGDFTISRAEYEAGLKGKPCAPLIPIVADPTLKRDEFKLPGPPAPLHPVWWKEPQLAPGALLRCYTDAQHERVVLSLVLSPKESRTASAEWSQQLREKVAASAERDRCQVLVDLQDEP